MGLDIKLIAKLVGLTEGEVQAAIDKKILVDKL